MKERPMLNIFGSLVYETGKHGEPIVGDIMIMGEERTMVGIEFKGITMKVVHELADAYVKHFAEWREEVTARLILNGVLRE